MITTILAATPETTNYMIAGYAVIFSIMFFYILSIFIRRRNLKRDLELLEEMDKKDD